MGLETERQKMLGVFNLMNLSDTLIDFQKRGKHFTQWKVVKRCQPKCFSETMYKSGREGGGVSAGGCRTLEPGQCKEDVSKQTKHT